MGKLVKAISLWEPWASLMFTGAKTWETRGWETKYRGDLLICAAKLALDSQRELILKLPLFQMGLQPIVGNEIDYATMPKNRVTKSNLQFGKALCLVNLVECRSSKVGAYIATPEERAFGDYSPNRFVWFTQNLRRIKNPFPVKGKQGFFNVELSDDVEFEEVL